MMPMPPTSREIEATTASSRAMIWLDPLAVSAIWLRLRTAKSSTSPGCRRWAWRRMVETWLMAACTWSGLAAWTKMLLTKPVSRGCRPNGLAAGR